MKKPDLSLEFELGEALTLQHENHSINAVLASQCQLGQAYYCLLVAPKELQNISEDYFLKNQSSEISMKTLQSIPIK